MLEEVVVSSRKLGDERLQDVPQSILAISSKQIQDFAIGSFEDYARLVPSLSFIDIVDPSLDLTDFGAESLGDFDTQLDLDQLAVFGARLEDVVDLTTFHAPGSDRGLFAWVKNEYMKGPAYPAWMAVTVHELAFGAVVEIKAVAIRGWNPRIRREAAPR